MNIDTSDFDRIANEILDESSPVGIDAKKTHILILHKLEMMQKQLDRLEHLADEILNNQ